MPESPRYRHAEGVIPRRIAGELVLVPTDTTTVFQRTRRAELYVLNSSGERLWDLLTVPRTAADLVETLIGEYDVGASLAEADVERFIESMLAIGAVTAA